MNETKPLLCSCLHSCCSRSGLYWWDAFSHGKGNTSSLSERTDEQPCQPLRKRCVIHSTGTRARTACGRKRNRVSDSDRTNWKDAPIPTLRSG